MDAVLQSRIENQSLAVVTPLDDFMTTFLRGSAEASSIVFGGAIVYSCFTLCLLGFRVVCLQFVFN